MNRTSFSKGLAIGLFLSFFLWSGIIYGVSSIFDENTPDDSNIELEDKASLDTAPFICAQKIANSIVH